MVPVGEEVVEESASCVGRWLWYLAPAAAAAVADDDDDDDDDGAGGCRIVSRSRSVSLSLSRSSPSDPSRRSLPPPAEHTVAHRKNGVEMRDEMNVASGFVVSSRLSTLSIQPILLPPRLQPPSDARTSAPI